MVAWLQSCLAGIQFNGTDVITNPDVTTQHDEFFGGNTLVMNWVCKLGVQRCVQRAQRVVGSCQEVNLPGLLMVL